MRNAEAEDYWKKIYKRQYDKSIDYLCLNNLNGIPDFDLGSGIHAICGFNGAGKSSVLLSLKDILGVDKNEYDLIKIGGGKLEAIISSNSIQQIYSNSDVPRFIELDDNKDTVWFIDQDKLLNIVKFLCQDNLQELLDQYEPLVLDKNYLDELNYIVGKTYDKITVVNIEDEDENIVPYFIVESYGISYDSLNMGLGEHWLFYIWWVIFRCPKNSLILIEEPETFIGIKSQEKLMNLMAKKITKKGITVLLTTHSPYIIKHIRNESITIITRYKNQVDVCKSNDNMNLLCDLGLEEKRTGTIFVEDNLSRLFLLRIISLYTPSLSKKYNVEFVGGESLIKERLSFPYSKFIDYNFIGMYDGDMKGKIETYHDEGWIYDFLPTDEAVEKEFRSLLYFRLDEIAASICKQKSEMIRILSKIEGENHHDWYTLLSIELGVSIDFLMEKMFPIWIQEGNRIDNVEKFSLCLLEYCK